MTNPRTLSRALRVLLAIFPRFQRERLWTEDGPTDRAVTYLEQDGGKTSSGERALILSAWALWNGRGEVKLAQVINTLDDAPCEALLTLVLAARRGDAAVERWIAQPSARKAHFSGMHCGSAACDGLGGPKVAQPRQHSDRPFCRCRCRDCRTARAAEDATAATAATARQGEA